MKSLFAAMTMLTFGTLMLFLVVKNRPEVNQYSLIEQQKTLQVQAQTSAIQVVADKIPSMWPIIFLSCAGFITIVIVMYMMYRVNVINYNREINYKQFTVSDNDNDNAIPTSITLNDVKRMREIIQRYERNERYIEVKND